MNRMVSFKFIFTCVIDPNFLTLTNISHFITFIDAFGHRAARWTILILATIVMNQPFDVGCKVGRLSRCDVELSVTMWDMITIFNVPMVYVSAGIAMHECRTRNLMRCAFEVIEVSLARPFKI